MANRRKKPHGEDWATVLVRLTREQMALLDQMLANIKGADGAISRSDLIRAAVTEYLEHHADWLEDV